jgi:hypothetical protein
VKLAEYGAIEQRTVEVLNISGNVARKVARETQKIAMPYMTTSHPCQEQI